MPGVALRVYEGVICGMLQGLCAPPVSCSRGYHPGPRLHRVAASYLVRHRGNEVVCTATFQLRTAKCKVTGQHGLPHECEVRW